MYYKGEEVQNPQKAIPISILVCLLVCFVAYFGVSAIVTLMVPYYSADPNAPLPEAFDAVGWHYAKYVIAVGAICGLSSRYRLSEKKNILISFTYYNVSQVLLKCMHFILFFCIGNFLIHDLFHCNKRDDFIDYQIKHL